MATQTMMTGMQGVFLVAAELSYRGFVVSPTSRSAIGADLLVTDQRCRKAWSVQVKTNRVRAVGWLVSKGAEDISSDSHIYVFVKLQKDGQLRPDFYVVPSDVVARNMLRGEWRAFRTKPADRERYKEAWRVFGDPLGREVP